MKITDADMQLLAKDWRAFEPTIPEGAEQVTDRDGVTWVREPATSPLSAGRVRRLWPKKGATTLTEVMVQVALRPASLGSGWSSTKAMVDRGLLAAEIADVTDLSVHGHPVRYSLTERGVYALGALAFASASEALQ